MKLLRLLKDELSKDIHIWVQHKIINVDQAQKICELYGIDYNKSATQNKGYSLRI
ncbi:MAG: hypothetical protein OEV78_12045 [Spirochaetia bacterium]|nr:hypothetical protein [Spirochaetia bacterium]